MDRRAFVSLYALAYAAHSEAMKASSGKSPIITLIVPVTGVVGTPVSISGSVQPGSGQRGSQISSWGLAYGDGQGQSGNSRATFAVLVTYDAEGTYTVSLNARSVDGATKAMSTQIVLHAVVDPPPITSAYGPQRNQTKPVGSVDIAPGSSIQSAVNANTNGTTFWLSAGTTQLAAPVSPKPEPT